MKALIILVILLTTSISFAVCQVWRLSYQYRPLGSINNICVYKASVQEVAIEANGQYCPAYIKYEPTTGRICDSNSLFN